MRKAKEKRICIICEGFEEVEYLGALLKKSVFSSKYEFILINAKTQNNIIPIYQEKFQSNSYHIVLVFCDTDKTPSDKYKKIKREINALYDNDVADDIVIFGNPCTMQIILSHFTDIKVTSQSKSVNAKYIEDLTGIKEYKATEQQRKELFGKINRSNYEKMKTNIAELSTDDKEKSSTNFLKFLEHFESDDDSWIDKIEAKL